MSACGRKRTSGVPLSVNYVGRIRCKSDDLNSGEHDMNIVTNCASRLAQGACISTLLLSLFACVGQPTGSQVQSTTEVTINAEDVEQVPISQNSGPEGAVEATRPCRSPTGGGIECDVAGINNRALQEGSPNVFRN